MYVLCSYAVVLTYLSVVCHENIADLPIRLSDTQVQ